MSLSPIDRLATDCHRRRPCSRTAGCFHRSDSDYLCISNGDSET